MLRIIGYNIVYIMIIIICNSIFDKIKCDVKMSWVGNNSSFLYMRVHVWLHHISRLMKFTFDDTLFTMLHIYFYFYFWITKRFGQKSSSPKSEITTYDISFFPTRSSKLRIFDTMTRILSIWANNLYGNVTYLEIQTSWCIYLLLFDIVYGFQVTSTKLNHS